MKKRLIIIFSVIIIGLIIIMVMPLKDKNWTKELINSYRLEKISEDKIILNKKDKNIINEYIESYYTKDKYIILRTVINDSGLDVNYYIIDSKEDNVLGPLGLEEFNEKKDELEINNIKWIGTIDNK